MFQYLCLCFLSVFMHVQYDLKILFFNTFFFNKMFKNVTVKYMKIKLLNVMIHTLCWEPLF